MTERVARGQLSFLRGPRSDTSSDLVHVSIVYDTAGHSLCPVPFQIIY